MADKNKINPAVADMQIVKDMLALNNFMTSPKKPTLDIGESRVAEEPGQPTKKVLEAIEAVKQENPKLAKVCDDLREKISKDKDGKIVSDEWSEAIYNPLNNKDLKSAAGKVTDKVLGRE